MNTYIHILIVIVLSIEFDLTLNAQNQLLELEGGIKIGNTTQSPEAGQIRFNENNFEGYNGYSWIPLGKFNVKGTLTDYDGNMYYTIEIGGQEWMAENLRVQRYNDGEDMQITLGSNTLNLGATGSFHFPDDQFTNLHAYGGLYDWHAVNTQKLCPIGWHVPDSTEWGQFVDFLGGFQFAGNKIKEMGVDTWMPPNLGASNETGFAARGAGRKSTVGGIESFRILTHWWTTTSVADKGVAYSTSYNSIKVLNFYHPKNSGFSVRCLRNL